jgi:Tfp pilus assembly protein PilO
MNKQLLRDILDKIPFTLILAVYLAYLGYNCYQFFNDENGEIHLKQGELTTARDDIQKLEKRVKDVNDFMQSLSAKKQQLRQLAQELEDTKVSLSENLDVPDLMNTIYTEARRAGLSVSRLSPSGVKKFEFYEGYEFSFESTGVFFQYLAFLENIAGLRKILRVSEINLNPLPPQDASFVKVSANLRILAFRYLGTKADELGKVAANEGAGDAKTEKKAGSP